MWLTVLGGCGAWPEAGGACSGYLVEQDGFRLLLDPGYATVPRLLERTAAGDVDAVFVTHGHPDHCADLNPLLRARVLRDGDPAPPLPVYSPAGALDAVLALDRPGMLDAAYEWHVVDAGAAVTIGPWRVETRSLPHSVPNLGVRLSAAGRVLAYTGDTGPSTEVVDLARGADLFLAEASFVDEVPEVTRGTLSSARQAGRVRVRGRRAAPAADPPAARYRRGRGAGGGRRRIRRRDRCRGTGSGRAASPGLTPTSRRRGDQGTAGAFPGCR